MTPLRIILHPMDFFEHAQAAYFLACSLARDHKARLVVVHVVPPALTYHETAILVYGEETHPGQAPLEHHKETLLEKLRQFAAPQPGVQMEHHVLDGDPAETIIAFADKVKADLIVMGTHGRSGLSRLLMGSVAEQLVRRASCPVLTVKVPFVEVKVPAEESRA